MACIIRLQAAGVTSCAQRSQSFVGVALDLRLKDKAEDMAEQSTASERKGSPGRARLTIRRNMDL